MGAAVLLMAYGSPDSLDQMEPFLRDVLKGRPVSPETVRIFQDRYRTFGGRSPLLDISRRQAAQLEAVLGMPVRVGMRHWHPFIAEAARDLGDPIVGLPLAPQYSRFSVGEYHRALRETASARVIGVDQWHREPKFLDAWADRILAALKTHSPDALLFTAHSVPEDPADPYAGQLRETVEGILRRIPPVRWAFAYQSASTAPVRWLGPDVDSKLRELRADGVRRLVAVPISFVSDHAEVLYDLDHLHRKSARELGMTLDRCESLNEHPLLIQALSDVVRSVL
ncbi:MAG TPA: ferrochelatase [Candidatus Polarisedimenticolia bacterium]|nr:ferrochelatase [Candidatus Polarisedimenticolia bacterium]